jgi:hypothetical protein
MASRPSQTRRTPICIPVTVSERDQEHALHTYQAPLPHIGEEAEHNDHEQEDNKTDDEEDFPFTPAQLPNNVQLRERRLAALGGTSLLGELAMIFGEVASIDLD